VEILTARQKKAEELKRLTDLASQMAEMQLAELRAEIKVSSEHPSPNPASEIWSPLCLICIPRLLLPEGLTPYSILSFTG
jgi:hypothetical protein